MGTIIHNAIIVTHYDREKLKNLRKKAIELFGDVIPKVTPEATNGYCTLLIPPDGSKEGWSESNEMDDKRERFIKILSEDGFYEWVEVCYGLDLYEGAEIVNQFREAADEEESYCEKHDDEDVDVDVGDGLSYLIDESLNFSFGDKHLYMTFVKNDETQMLVMLDSYTSLKDVYDGGGDPNTFSEISLRSRLEAVINTALEFHKLKSKNVNFYTGLLVCYMVDKLKMEL